MAYYRYDGTPTTPMREVALTVSTLGLWVGYSLIMEAWYLYKKGRARKQEQAGSPAVSPAPPPRTRYSKPRRRPPPGWPQLSRRRPDPGEDDARD